MKIIHSALLLFCCLILLQCATSKQIYTPSGEKGYSINCSGTALTWGHCYEKASELCGSRGYKIITTSKDQGAMVTGTQYGLFGGSVIQRSMIIKCNHE